MKKKGKTVCSRCHHGQNCLRPCWFMESLLSRVTDGSLEKQTGDNEITHYGHYYEKRFSDLHEATLRKIYLEVADDNQPDPDSPQADQRFDDLEYQPAQKTADIFYMRFFLGKSYDEIGEKYRIDRRSAASAYGHARARVLEILKVLDGRDKGFKFCADRARNIFTKHEKAFILNKVFGLAFREIAELLGYAGPDQIQHKVNDMYKRYREKYFDPAVG